MTPQNGKIKILIVEDDLPVAMMLTHLLAQNGIETEVATTGRKALQMAADGHFDLITLDADLPDVSGYELCRLLREKPFFQTPIVFVSARCLIEDRQLGLDAGAVDYIAKPFETFEFAPRILSHIKQTETVA
ncbi:MAG: response regulator transcription factor [Limisphaerales bacterium]